MKIFINKYRILLSIIIFLIFISALIFFVINPLIGEISSKNQRIQEILAMQDNKKERLAELPDLRGQFEAIQADEPKLADPINKEKAVEVIEKIESIAEATKNEAKISVEEQGVAGAPARKSVNKPDEKESIVSDLPSDAYIKMKIAVSGKYGDIINFLNKLENIQYYSDILSINISTQTETGSSQYFQTSAVQPGSPADGTKTESENPPKDVKLGSAIVIVFYVNK